MLGGAYLLDKKQWFCHLQVISSLVADEQDSHDTAPLNKTVILHQPKWAPTMLNLTGKPKHSFWRYSLENTILLLINLGLFYLLWSDVCFNNWYLYPNILEFHSTYKPSFYSSNPLASSYPPKKVPWTTAAWIEQCFKLNLACTANLVQ